MKQIQHLQDQVRARDLVIELMYVPPISTLLICRKKAEQERTEKELKDKLDRQRKELELRLGLSAEPPPPPTLAEKPIRSVRSSSRGGKTAAKVGSAIQARKTSGTKRKRSTASDPSGSCRHENVAQAEDEVISQEDCSPVGEGSEGGKATRAVVKTPSRDVVGGDLLLEEFDQAFEELFNE